MDVFHPAQESHSALVTAQATLPPATEDPRASASLAAPAEAIRAITPAVFERSSFEYYFDEFVRQFQPVGTLETTVLRDLARHAAAMEAWNESAGALLRQRASRLPALALPTGADGDEIEDAALAAAVTSPDVQQCESHAQKRSRGFYRVLRTLQDLQAQRLSHDTGEEALTPPNWFPTEQACEQHLRDRFEQGRYVCPRCGSRRGHYLAARRSWECAECKRQTGIRAGTVAADSPLPLVAWFRSIQLLLWRPTMGTTELGMNLRINRSTTVRSVARRIRAAICDNRASELLAGLDRFDANGAQELPASSAPVEHETSGGHASPPQSAPVGATTGEI